MTTAQDKGVTISEASAKLGKSAKTLHRWIDEGKVRAWKVTEDGPEKWFVDIAHVQDNGHVMSKSNVHDVQAELQAEILDLKDEMTLSTSQLQAKDKQIADLNERLHEANTLVLQGQQKQIPGPKRWWQSRKRS